MNAPTIITIIIIYRNQLADSFKCWSGLRISDNWLSWVESNHVIRILATDWPHWYEIITWHGNQPLIGVIGQVYEYPRYNQIIIISAKTRPHVHWLVSLTISSGWSWDYDCYKTDAWNPDWKKENTTDSDHIIICSTDFIPSSISGVES